MMNWADLVSVALIRVQCRLITCTICSNLPKAINTTGHAHLMPCLTSMAAASLYSFSAICKVPVLRNPASQASNNSTLGLAIQTDAWSHICSLCCQAKYHALLALLHSWNGNDQYLEAMLFSTRAVPIHHCIVHQGQSILSSLNSAPLEIIACCS